MTTTVQTQQQVNTFDFEEAKQILTELVAQKGADYVYENRDDDGHDICLYFTEDGAPSCIVGNYLSNKGYGPEDVLEGTGADALYLLSGAPRITKALLKFVQEQQDVGVPWGDAVREGERLAAEYMASGSTALPARWIAERGGLGYILVEMAG